MRGLPEDLTTLQQQVWNKPNICCWVHLLTKYLFKQTIILMVSLEIPVKMDLTIMLISCCIATWTRKNHGSPHTHRRSLHEAHSGPYIQEGRAMTAASPKHTHQQDRKPRRGQELTLQCNEIYIFLVNIQ